MSSGASNSTFPSMSHAGVVLFRDIDMNQVDSTAPGFLVECQDECGIRIGLMEIHASPALHDQSSGIDANHRSPKHSIECLELAPGLRADLYGASGDLFVEFWIDVNLVKLPRGGGKSHGLQD